MIRKFFICIHRDCVFFLSLFSTFLVVDTIFFSFFLQRTTVVAVRAVDGDSKNPNDVVYTLVAGNDQGKFLLDTAVGDIRVADRIDRDDPGFSGVFTLTVRATEVSTRGSIAGAYSETTFEIQIDDVNDERAEFIHSTSGSKEYSVSIPESTPVGTYFSLSPNLIVFGKTIILCTAKTNGVLSSLSSFMP